MPLAHPPDLDAPARCPGGCWRGPLRDAVLEPDNLIRCPTCGRPVVCHPESEAKR